MRVELLGLAIETPKVSVSLWSSWKASQLETKVFNSIGQVPDLEKLERDDEMRLSFRTEQQWQAVMDRVVRVMKGWQEEAAGRNEKRLWGWMIDGDRDAYGYDPMGEAACLWGWFRLFLERGDPGEFDKSEQVELQSLSFRFWPVRSS
ncbi:MAG: hypothetical protein ACFCD0_02520 [Gemmataceae bacterium]